jgi:hypothetical protein
MNHVEIKNYRFKRKEVDISKSNTSFNFLNDETPNLKERLLKSLRVEIEEHPAKFIILKSYG